MTVRTTLKSTTPGAITGDAFMDSVAQHIDAFWDASALRLTSIGGTANAVTAVVDPVLDTGLVAGMAFWYTATATNTGAMTMTIGTEAAVSMVSSADAALGPGDIVNGTTYPLFFDGTKLRVMATLGVLTLGAVVQVDTFTANGTLTKPTGFPADGLVIVEVWGGGGGGGSSAGDGGGGGGAYNRKEFAGSDFGATETVTIGAGGAAGVAGGKTSVGTLIEAYGGGEGGPTSGGGGGGQLSAGGPGTGVANGGRPFGGAAAATGGDGNAGGGGTTGDGGDGIWGGGGGGAGTADTGGDSLYGGGGGGETAGGVSVFGGDGGAQGVGGAIPGGGGGNLGASGARGEAIVRWIG